MIEGKGSRVIAESTQLPVSAERVPLDELSVFDGGNFKLWYFPEGMTLKTRSIKPNKIQEKIFITHSLYESILRT